MSTDQQARRPRARAVLAAGEMLAGLAAGRSPAPREISAPPGRAMPSRAQNGAPDTASNGASSEEGS
jgi:hypothetical protein